MHAFIITWHICYKCFPLQGKEEEEKKRPKSPVRPPSSALPMIRDMHVSLDHALLETCLSHMLALSVLLVGKEVACGRVHCMLCFCRYHQVGSLEESWAQALRPAMHISTA